MEKFAEAGFVLRSCRARTGPISSAEPGTILIIGAPVVMVAESTLFNGFVSDVCELTLALFVMSVPLGIVTPTLTTKVMFADPPGPIVFDEHVKVPTPPTAGAAQLHPCGAEKELNVVPVGSGSETIRLVAVPGPLFLTVSV